MDEAQKYKNTKMREEFGRMLKEAVGPPPLLSPEIVSPFLGLSHTSLYTRLKDPGYLPGAVECELISNFLLGVYELKKEMRVFIALEAFQAFTHNALATSFFNPELLKILSSGGALENRINRLVKKILKDAGEKLKEKGGK